VLQEDVLRRLQPRALAVCRCVCKAWRAAIDSRRLLRPDLLPLSVGGIFLSLLFVPAPPLLFAPASVGREVGGGRLQACIKMNNPWNIPHISDCCNGLVLVAEHVVNPATRWSARVPPCPALPDDDDDAGDEYHLLFDPSLSPHFEVLVIQGPHDYHGEGSAEWPPSPCVMWVYSSTTERWEKRPFVREGGPAGNLAEVLSAPEPDNRHAVYCHGALYAHCKSDFIMR
jgi:hypothetical protein